MPAQAKTEKGLWISLLELSLIAVGYLAMLPTAFLIAFVVLLYFKVASFFKPPELGRLSFRRKISGDRITDEDEIIVEETIRNDEARSVFVEVMSRLPEELIVSQGSNHYVAYVSGRGSRRIRYKVKPSFTGNYAFKKTSIRTLNHLLTTYDESEKDVTTMFSVYPMLEEVKKFPFGRMSVRPIQGVIRSKTPGRGTEYFEIRSYNPGDEFRRVNWKASARMGTLLSNEYDWERMADIYMVLDSTSSSGYFLKDYIRACVSLIDFFLRMGNRVGLVVIGKFWNWIVPGSGRRQLIRLVDNLIQERPGDPITLSYHVENTMRVVSQMSTVILLSSMKDERIRELAKRIVERRQKIMAVIPTSTSIRLKREGSEQSWTGVAKELIKLERDNTLKFLKAIGLTAIEWDPETPISETVEMLQRWAGREPITAA